VAHTKASIKNRKERKPLKKERKEKKLNETA
jgi:hypothetical protein